MVNGLMTMPFMVELTKKVDFVHGGWFLPIDTKLDFKKIKIRHGNLEQRFLTPFRTTFTRTITLSLTYENIL